MAASSFARCSSIIGATSKNIRRRANGTFLFPDLSADKVRDKNEGDIGECSLIQFSASLDCATAGRSTIAYRRSQKPGLIKTLATRRYGLWEPFYPCTLSISLFRLSRQRSSAVAAVIHIAISVVEYGARKRFMGYLKRCCT